MPNRADTPEYELITACSMGNLTRVTNLLESKSVDVNTVDNYGRTPLIYASEMGEEMIVQSLITAAADVNKAAPFGRTPLMFACKEGNLETVRLLVNNGADVNAATTDNGWTPLFFAIMNSEMCNSPESLEKVSFLIEKGANVKVTANNGKTPLMWANEKGCISISKILSELVSMKGSARNRVTRKGGYKKRTTIKRNRRTLRTKL